MSLQEFKEQVNQLKEFYMSQFIILNQGNSWTSKLRKALAIADEKINSKFRVCSQRFSADGTKVPTTNPVW